MEVYDRLTFDIVKVRDKKRVDGHEHEQDGLIRDMKQRQSLSSSFELCFALLGTDTDT